jgi:hypothetical protein
VTHVALILNDGGQTWVYEATPGEVRRLVLDRYYRELADYNHGRHAEKQLRVRLYPPKVAYTDCEVAGLQTYLDTQLGRRYSIKGYVRKKPGDGIHCAELVSSALSSTGRGEFARTYGINPMTLVAQIAATHGPPQDVALPAHESEGTWCQRSRAWWAGLFAWCGWACWETCTFYP